MPDPAIDIQGLGKRYTLGEMRPLGQRLAGAVRRCTGRAVDRGDDPRELWALRDVNLRVEPGEVVGIIGRNGAGKSTLLKILSRITDPTEGFAAMRGRVASLLEVGTGFHPELTGRENIYLNGAILGMSRREVRARIGEIIDFSGVEKFLDTPVKRYSSGMRVRLAFAVAAHLDPEILIVDEVLAVGDAEFQKRCMGKMSELAEGGGRTILFVSHNIGAVQTLCGRSLFLDRGIARYVGPTASAIDAYVQSCADPAATNAEEFPRRNQDHTPRVRIVRVAASQSTPNGFYLHDPVLIDVELEAATPQGRLRLGIAIRDVLGSPVLAAFTPQTIEVKRNGRSRFRVELSDTRLAPGAYHMAISVGTGRQDEPRSELDVVHEAGGFRILPAARNGQAVFNWRREYGCIIHQQTAMSPMNELERAA